MEELKGLHYIMSCRSQSWKRFMASKSTYHR